MLPPIIDPHQRLADLVAHDSGSYAALSRMIGRPDGFLRRFAIDRVPSRLRDDERQMLAAYFDIGEHELGGPPPPKLVWRDPRARRMRFGRRGAYVD